MNEEIKVSDRDREAYYRQLVPYGYADVEAAIRTAKEAGKDADWAAEQVKEYMWSTDSRIDQVDPVAAVYDSLLQIARNEIEELTGFDLSNDAKGTELYVSGNYMCTSFDYGEEVIEQITQKLADNDVNIEDLSEECQWVLAEIAIDQEKIDKAKNNETSSS